jgi:hypothetical protein
MIIKDVNLDWVNWFRFYDLHFLWVSLYAFGYISLGLFLSEVTLTILISYLLGEFKDENINHS